MNVATAQQTAYEFAKLLASDGANGHEFGNSVSISGRVAIIGALNGGDGIYKGRGAAYIFRFDGAAWIQEAKLTPSSPTTSSRRVLLQSELENAAV